MLFLLGLLLLGATGAFIGLAVSENTGGPDQTVMMLDHRIATMNGLAIFLAGVTLTVIVGLACAMMAAGAARARRRRALGRRAQEPAESRSHPRERDPHEERDAAPPRTEDDTTAAGGQRPRRHHFRFGH
ncbi:hypothetical protein GCM10010275_63320 [Streptomyces litmocidini]|uniref:hypothetical protein n=1 Tax=Streptomyces litmocidini TaxID=67318 RepID=UPI00167E1D5D|nr:hypothetical protein [Streptomyces litmocidini]GGV13521.1 hypothetical protein GCM10010275_63320 [Streptomyces litmocidini]